MLHGCPLITTKNLTSSKSARNQLNLTFRIISSMTCEICRLIIERGKWVNDCLWLTVDGVVSGTVGYWGYLVWIHVFTRLKLFEALSLGFKFVDEKFWTLLSIWLIYSIECKVLNNRPSIRLSLHRSRIMFEHTIALLKLQLQHRFGFIHFVSLQRIHMRAVAWSYWSGKGFYFGYLLWFLWLLNDLWLRKVAKIWIDSSNIWYSWNSNWILPYFPWAWL